MRSQLFALSLATLSAAGLWGGTAKAVDPVAESMFQQALTMMQDGDFEKACQTLEASQKLEKKSGTLIVLANCYEHLGRTATAWAQYKEAAAMARSEGRDKHAAKATELARKLESQLTKLRIDAQQLQGGVDLKVTLDGKVVVAGSLGVAFAVDPGHHVIEASAPGRRTWVHEFEIVGASPPTVIAVPLLEEVPEEPANTAPAPVASKPEPEPVVPVVSSDVAGDAGPQAGGPPTWAWVAGGTGVVLLGAATFFFLDASSAGSDLDAQCGSSRNKCPTGYDADADFSREKRGYALGWGLGVAGLVGAGVFVVGLTWSSDDGQATLQPSVAADQRSGFLGVNGTF
ncbi:MAG: tetratricopeptide repeat protein [Polyangiaceae bacterium]|nr:tetratricopeptide repeat protein [Myxococcales bacterium]MCB9590540.1 tetratricopeptide repeat protein [Polyangiaceae bacterium]MCB9608535.1 tetratricopeptide repeat protein [Polyangiaceae bacterium]